MSLIKINQGATVILNGNVKTAGLYVPPVPSGPLQVPLIEGDNVVGTHGDTSTFSALPSLTLPYLPYVIPSGVLKGLRITTTPTQPNDFLASPSAAASLGDVVRVQRPDFSTFSYHFNSSTLAWHAGLRAASLNHTVSPTANINLVVRGNSTLRVWYKWPAGQWV